MKQLYTLIIVLLAFKSFGQTSISNGNVSGTWTKSGSPYLINGNIQVLADSTLSIEPSVKVIFKGYYKFIVKGRITAIGTKTDSIFFTASDTSKGWSGGIQLINTNAKTDTSKFIFCNIQYGKTATANPYDNGGAFYITASKVIISNCHISNCVANGGGGGIYSEGSQIVSNNTIINNKCLSGGIGGGGASIAMVERYPIISYLTILHKPLEAVSQHMVAQLYSTMSFLITMYIVEMEGEEFMSQAIP